MRSTKALAFRVIVIGTGFLVLALASITLTLWVTWQLEGGAAAVNEAGRMRMMSYRLALHAATNNRATVPEQIRSMDTTLELLDAGDPSRPLLVPWNDETRAELTAVRRQWQTLRADWISGSQGALTEDVDAFVGHIDRFVSLIEQHLSRWTAVLRTFQLTMVGLAIGSAVLLLYAMHLMVLDPLRRLGTGMSAIRAGDFGARVQVASADEFGELAAGFNAMASHLQSLYGDLEAKVHEKTDESADSLAGR